MHLYFPASFLLKSVNGIEITLLSETLVHVMCGAGLPTARHFSVEFSPSVIVWFPEISVMFGETAKTKLLAYRILHIFDSTILFFVRSDLVAK